MDKLELDYKTEENKKVIETIMKILPLDAINAIPGPDDIISTEEQIKGLRELYKIQTCLNESRRQKCLEKREESKN